MCLGCGAQSSLLELNVSEMPQGKVENVGIPDLTRKIDGLAEGAAGRLHVVASSATKAISKVITGFKVMTVLNKQIWSGGELQGRREFARLAGADQQYVNR